MEGLLNWCIHMIVTILGLILAKYVGKPILGWYVGMCELRWVSTVSWWGLVEGNLLLYQLSC